MLVDHAFTLPMKLLWPDGGAPPAVPLCINTVQFPLPSARRVWALGQALGEAIRAWDSDKRVLVLGSGGLSHQLDGRRAGFINKDFDQRFMGSLVEQPEWATGPAWCTGTTTSPSPTPPPARWPWRPPEPAPAPSQARPYRATSVPSMKGRCPYSTSSHWLPKGSRK